MWCIIHQIPIFRTWLNATCRLMGYPISWHVQCPITIGRVQHSNTWCLVMCVPLSWHVIYIYIYIFDGWYNTSRFRAFPLWENDLWKFVWMKYFIRRICTNQLIHVQCRVSCIYERGGEGDNHSDMELYIPFKLPTNPTRALSFFNGRVSDKTISCRFSL